MPMKNFSSHRRLPPLLLYILKNFDAWLIGSSINYVEGHTDTPPKDYDCIVSPSDWLAVAQVLLTQEKIDINTFGGFKVLSKGILIDFWPQTLSEFLKSS